MDLQRPVDRPFYARNVLTTGAACELPACTWGIVDMDCKNATEKGLPLVADFIGANKKRDEYQFRFGHPKAGTKAGLGYDRKNGASPSFKLTDILEVTASAPDRTEQSLDVKIIGYNGHDADTAFPPMVEGMEYEITIHMRGGYLEMFGVDPIKGLTIPIRLRADDDCDVPEDACDITCDPCRPLDCKSIVKKAIHRALTEPIAGVDGDFPLAEFLDIHPIFDCKVEESDNDPIFYDYYCMSICDTGDVPALRAVQAQYPEWEVCKTGRDGAITSYKMLLPRSEGAPEAYVQSLGTIMPKCDECPENYELVKGGLMYSVTLEDDGVDLSADVEALPNAVVGTAIKQGQDKGCGHYTIVVEKALTKEDKVTFAEAQPTASTYCIGEVASICNTDQTNSTEWEECGECSIIQCCYTMSLADNECGGDRLKELQAAYPEYTITVLEDGEGSPVRQACQTSYKLAGVPSELLCPDECDPLFEDTYKFLKVPRSYERKEWKLVPKVENCEGCLCGIFFRGKDILSCPPDCLRDHLPYIEGAVEFDLTGGYIVNKPNRLGEPTMLDERFPVTIISEYKPRTHVAENVSDEEAESNLYHHGIQLKKNNVSRFLTGEERCIQCGEQFVDYSVTVAHRKFQQYNYQAEADTITHIIRVPVENYAETQDLVNKLAVAAGCDPVFAFATPV